MFDLFFALEVCGGFFFWIDNVIVFNNFIMMCPYLSLVLGGPFNLQLMF